MKDDCVRDYLLLGAGPASLQLAYCLQKKGIDYCIVERRDRAGSFFLKQPRHGMLISINKVHTGSDNPDFNLRMDWNSLISEGGPLFTDYTKDYFPQSDVIVRYLQDFAEHFKLNIVYNTTINRISRSDGLFCMTDAEGHVFRGRRLIIATGLFQPDHPDIPGLELAEQYNDMSIDPEEYTNKRVLVIGKGNSAFETADNLIENAASIHICAPESVTHAWQSHYVGHLRAVNNNFLDTYQLKSQNAVLDAHVANIAKKGDKYVVDILYSHAELNGQPEPRTIEFDRVLACTGFSFDRSIFDESCKPECNVKHPLQGPDFQSVNIPDLYFAGTLMAMRDHHKTMSGFIHGFRHNVVSLAEILLERYHEMPIESEKLSSQPDQIVDRMVEHLNDSPGIYLQPGFLCSVVEKREDGLYFYPTMIKDHASKYFADRGNTCFFISLEYGDQSHISDPFNIYRKADLEYSDETLYLHPIYRQFKDGKLKGTLHIPEDLENDYSGEMFREMIHKHVVGEWL